MNQKYLHNITKGVNSKLLRSFLPHGVLHGRKTSAPDPKLVKRAVRKCQKYCELWNNTLLAISNKLSDYIPDIPENGDRVAVIVEPRQHNDLITILKDYMYFLNIPSTNPSWKLQIFHGSNNEKWLKDKLSRWNHVTYTNLGVNNLTVPQYSKLLKSSDFWNQIDGEHVLIFQTDSLMLRHGIEKFMDYDYIGAPWKVSKEHTLVVGNGGLSLRKKSAMLRVIRDFPDDTSHPEDLYFCKHLLESGANLPPKNIACAFSVETIYHESPLGVHKPVKISPEKLERVMIHRFHS